MNLIKKIMEEFKVRLIREYVELDERTEKLEEFILKKS